VIDAQRRVDELELAPKKKTKAAREAQARTVEAADRSLQRAQTDFERDKQRREEKTLEAQQDLEKKRTERDKADASVASLEKTKGQRSALQRQFAEATTGGRISLLQANEELGLEFLATASFEKKVLGAIEDLILRPKSETNIAFRSNLGKIPSNEILKEEAKTTLERFALNTLEPISVTSRSLASIREQLEVGATQNLGAQQRANLIAILARTGSTNIGSRFNAFVGQLEDGDLGVSIGEARDILSSQAERLRTPRERVGLRPQGGPGSLVPGPKIIVEPTAEEIQSAQLLEQVVRVLTEQMEVQKETNRKLDNGGFPAGGD